VCNVEFWPRDRRPHDARARFDWKCTLTSKAYGYFARRWQWHDIGVWMCRATSRVIVASRDTGPESSLNDSFEAIRPLERPSSETVAGKYMQCARRGMYIKHSTVARTLPANSTFSYYYNEFTEEVACKLEIQTKQERNSRPRIITTYVRRIVYLAISRCDLRCGCRRCGLSSFKSLRARSHPLCSIHLYHVAGGHSGAVRCHSSDNPYSPDSPFSIPTSTT
jgi:hypothetical protein